ncbi:MAG: hypothetical protein J0I18_23370, partial [Actinobacteria bacterium]|nr:hypothetical protein [Actinomycetota bacterium]
DVRAQHVDFTEQFREKGIRPRADVGSSSHVITTFLAWKWLLRRTGFEPRTARQNRAMSARMGAHVPWLERKVGFAEVRRDIGFGRRARIR